MAIRRIENITNSCKVILHSIDEPGANHTKEYLQKLWSDFVLLEQEWRNLFRGEKCVYTPSFEGDFLGVRLNLFRRFQELAALYSIAPPCYLEGRLITG